MQKILIVVACGFFGIQFAWADGTDLAPVIDATPAQNGNVVIADVNSAPQVTQDNSATQHSQVTATDNSGAQSSQPVATDNSASNNAQEVTADNSTSNNTQEVTADNAAVENPNNKPEEPVQLTKNMQVITKTENFSDPTLSYSVKSRHPLITGKNLSAGAKAFNKTMLNVMKEQMQQFKMAATMDQVPMKNFPAALRQDSFSVSYDLAIVKPRGGLLISVKLTIEGMQAGRSHPFHAQRVINFDLTTGREIKLAELFKPHSRYLQLLAAYSSKSLDKKLKKDDWMVSAGTKPDPQNFKNWNLQGDSILITFDEYQVAPYSYGPQEVEIPYAELKKVLSVKAPIADCVKETAGCGVVG